MIKKILKIKNIGRYDIDSANDDMSFGGQTIVFGANKIGKTTLTSIFRSLKEGEGNYITCRKTFGCDISENQECEILYDNGAKNVFGGDWSNKDVEIFDNEFIQKNIFVGDKIEQNHRTALHKILIDEGNLKIQEDVDLAEDEYRELMLLKELIKKEIGINFDSFIKLKDEEKIEDVDNKIKENKDKQTQFANQRRLNILKSTTKLSFDFELFEKNIKQNIDTKLEEKIKKHIKECWSDENEDVYFLNLGIDIIAEDKNICPFCGQSLMDASALINNMKEFFSDAYKQTQTSINESIGKFKNIDIEKEVAQFKAEGFEFKTLVDIEGLSEKLKTIFSKIEEKQKDLSVDIKINELSEYQNYKNVVETMSEEIESLKIEAINITELQEEEKKLKLNKERFSVEGEERYKRYQENENSLKTKKQKIDQLNSDLKTNLNILFGAYLTEINIILNSSHANFKLAKLESISNRTMKDKFFCDYAFVFDNTHSVNILDDADKPQFKNTLSDSDKRVFAFAFFIAKLKKDDSSSDKIVLLDDPFTCLDEDRRDSMIDTLGNLDCKQMVIFSHSRSFVKRCILKFKKNIEETSRDVKSLRLINNDSNKTEINKLDVENDNDFLDGIEQYLHILINSDTGNIMSNYDCIRKIIEYIVKAKYGNLLTSEEKRLPMKYFINPNCKSQMKDQINESDYQENHHDAIDLPTPEELLNKRNDFINNILPGI